MTAITTCGSVVGNVVLPYSFVYDFFGPLPIAILCIIVFPLGALLIAFCFEEIIIGDVVKLCVFYSFMNLGTTFFDLVCCMTVISYFPTRRGAVVALLKTFVGLGSAITGSLYLGYFGGAIEAFFTF
ncbi:hypothetical protein AGDE_14500 [Angomonas deanei]|nr:hypothetical protein AGDE_14500 [Angomonas deanei]|eukprot:EPY20743.1 hypothetical protein AGDE_14500 [Angomonas deanei]